MSVQNETRSDEATPVGPDVWSGWAPVYTVPASLEYGLIAEDGEEAAPVAGDPGVRAALGDLTACVAEEQAQRAAAEVARREAEGARHAAELEITRLAAELAAERARVAQLERDRDDVIRRAEDLVTAVRERADLRLSTELEADRRHWEDMVTGERRRVEVLEGERAALVRQVQEAWQSGATLRRARPLRPEPADRDRPEAAGGEGESEAGGEVELVAVGPDQRDAGAEIEVLRERLRAQLHKPPPLSKVEAGVDQLRESRLARDTEGRRRKK